MDPKPSSPAPIGPLQRVVAQPVTDPAELAAIEEMRKRQRQDVPAVRTRGSARVRGAGSTASGHEPGDLEALAATLSADELLAALERLVDRLGPDALRRLEERVRNR